MYIKIITVLLIMLALIACTSGQDITPTPSITPVKGQDIVVSLPTVTPIPPPSATPLFATSIFPTTAKPSVATSTVVPPTIQAEVEIIVKPLPTFTVQNTVNELSGQLIFMTGSGGELYIVNIDGSNLRRLAGGVIDPVVSPDGKRIAFTRWNGAEMGAVFTINIDGTGERAIVGDILQPKSPAWSPDGREIIISFQYGGLRDPQVKCKNFDLNDTIRLPKNIAVITKRHFSSDGILTICYIQAEDLRWRLRLIDTVTGSFEDLPTDEYSYNPSWDPLNYWRVIYDGNNGLMQLDVTNNNLWPITKDLRDTAPVFSPDGKYLAVTYKQHDHWEVYTIELETRERRRLTKPHLLDSPQYNSAAPVWSPDGRNIAFVTDRTNGVWEIWVMDSDGSSPHPLFSQNMKAQPVIEYRGMNERMINWIR